VADGSFMAALRAAAADEQLSEALAALHRATTAAGIADTEPGSIAEIGELLAARWAEQRGELEARWKQARDLERAVARVRALCDSTKQFDAGGMAVWVSDVLAALDGSGG
jgi:hypothetical protein